MQTLKRNNFRAITQMFLIYLRYGKRAKGLKGKIFSKWVEADMFDKHLRWWHEEKVYAQKQNASGALLSKKERQNLFINSSTYNCYPSKITILVLESNEKVFVHYLNTSLPLTGCSQCVLPTKFLYLVTPNNVLTSFKNLLLQWSAKRKL